MPSQPQQLDFDRITEANLFTLSHMMVYLTKCSAVFKEPWLVYILQLVNNASFYHLLVFAHSFCIWVHCEGSAHKLDMKKAHKNSELSELLVIVFPYYSQCMYFHVYVAFGSADVG